MSAPPKRPPLVYSCRRERLPPALRPRFVELEPDPAAEVFLATLGRTRAGRLRGALHALLRPWLSDFEVNGLLGTYPLFLLGTEQWQRLLGDARRGRLLDIGAGDGGVTAHLAPGFDEVVVTEAARSMRLRLARRGWVTHAPGVASDGVPGSPYDVISLLNVIDRTARPRTLLERARHGLAPGGSLVVSVPLPYRPHWYDGGRTHDPLERLPIDGPTWEIGATALVEGVLEPLGLEPGPFTRAPYLSAGDRRRELYVLDTVIATARVRS
ncbi:MAG: methyltransferase domain-containing protein [Polyangiaceae bacterium]|nr:methyltransferase domain-containing protein [Polyangiaceae bacterium]